MCTNLWPIGMPNFFPGLEWPKKGRKKETKPIWSSLLKKLVERIENEMEKIVKKTLI